MHASYWHLCIILSGKIVFLSPDQNTVLLHTIKLLLFILLLLTRTLSFVWKAINSCAAKHNVSILLFSLYEWFFFSASYILKLSQSEDYFKEEEKFRVDESKRSNSRKNKHESVTSDH
jgi:hypothetical protein